MRHSAFWVVVLTVLSGSQLSVAQTSSAAGSATPNRRQTQYTVAEFGVGALSLPTSSFLLTQSDTRTKGDAVPNAWIWMLYRVTKDFAIGAGSSLAIPFSKETTEREEGLERSHKRQYLLIDIVGRYYGLRLSRFEGWVGVTLGGSVISDQFRTETRSSDAVLLGPSGVGIRTEGLSAGVAAGIGWSLSHNWTLETTLRSAWWFLPSERACGVTGDCATLSSGVAMFSLGIGVGYRIFL